VGWEDRGGHTERGWFPSSPVDVARSERVAKKKILNLNMTTKTGKARSGEEPKVISSCGREAEERGKLLPKLRRRIESDGGGGKAKGEPKPKKNSKFGSAKKKRPKK